MTRLITAPLLLLVALSLGTAALAQDTSKAPAMTPEQKAEMDAYMKAGTPGPQHQRLAATAGSYDVKVRSWMEPGGPASEDKGTVTRTMMLDGRVLAENFKGTMMGGPLNGHGMMG